MTIRRRVRQAQTVVPFGVGAIFELQGESFLATDVRGWRNAPSLTAPRLARALKVQGFRAAPPARESDYDLPDAPGVPYMRFPSWLFCGGCRRMVRWNRDDERPGKAPMCGFCPANTLTPMRFVQVCARGHLGDVDWWYWAHATSDPERRETCSRDATLRYVSDEDSTGLEALHIRCDACPARRDLLGVLRDGALTAIGVRCSGRQPWQRREEAVACDSAPTVVQRGASNVYYPEVCSALDIPQEAAGGDASISVELAERIRAHVLWPTVTADPGTPKAAQYAALLASEVDLDVDVVLDLARQENRPGADEAPSEPAGLEVAEWRAFTATGSQERQEAASSVFVTRAVPLHSSPSLNISSALGERVRQVVVADRLREVRALLGFRRLSPDGPLIGVDPTGRARWLPAVETFGEGIFVAFDEAAVSQWENDERVRRRTAMLRVPVAPRYVMLHTLAHLLIRQLSFDCGYGTASMRERIYASTRGDRQAGLLIYTSAGDAEGTLGGLAHRGADGRLAETMIRLLEAGAWCSADPLCAEHMPTGRQRNLAACHSCALAPETSCEAQNAQLDRLLVVGGDGVPGFFAEVIDEARGTAAAYVEGPGE